MKSAGSGSAEERVKYYGAAAAMLKGRVKGQASALPVHGDAEAEYTLAGSDLAELTSLVAQSYSAPLRVAGSGVAGFYLCAKSTTTATDVRDRGSHGVREPLRC
jgi:hypothetical protein